MKRKREADDHKQKGMKLRSGKVITPELSELPKKLNDELEAELQNFKNLFSGNKEHAKELLKIIIEARGENNRFDIRRKIAEVYNGDDIDTTPLQGAAGGLAWLVVGNSSFYREHHIKPKYHDLVQARIKSFDLEVPIAGEGEIEDLS